MMKIMIFGSGGMLGHMVYNYLLETNRFQIVDSSYPVKANKNSYLLDVTDKQAVEKWIREEKPDIVVNCIGVLIKESKEYPANSIYLNSYFPHQLSSLLRKTGGRLIHLSTDCVFSGKKGGYVESDTTDAYDIYGRSKSLGEINNEYDITLRTSLVGPELKESGEGLLHWFLHKTGHIEGYTNVFWSGVTTLELAKAIEVVVNQEITGLVHFTSGIKISKYQLLKIIKETWKRNDIIINESHDLKVDKSLLRSKSLKYEYSSYEKMLYELKEWMDNHSELYKLYNS
jgi:dTDP-4-dehydrorhamnose reductase